MVVKELKADRINNANNADKDRRPLGIQLCNLFMGALKARPEYLQANRDANIMDVIGQKAVSVKINDYSMDVLQDEHGIGLTATIALLSDKGESIPSSQELSLNYKEVVLVNKFKDGKEEKFVDGEATGKIEDIIATVFGRANLQ